MKKPFDRILIIMFENQYRSYVLQDGFMNKLAAAGVDMTNYFGVFHPSQTNYLASLAGEVCGVTNDIPPGLPLPQRTLVDLMEEQSVSWKAYMEAYPNEAWKKVWKKNNYPPGEQPVNEFPDSKDRLARYFRKHNAFASFHSIQADPGRWAKIVDENQFWKDVNEGALPEYSWFTPDIWNDGHYLYHTHLDTDPRTQLVPQLSTWLEYVFFGNPAVSKIGGSAHTGISNIGLNLDIDLLLSDPDEAWRQSRVPERTLIVVTFDEADFDAKGYDTNYDGPNQVYTVLLGDMIRPGTRAETPFNHYSLIRTIEQNFGLGHLGKNDREANYFRFLWKEHFEWSAPLTTDLAGGARLAMASMDQNTHLVYTDKRNRLYHAIMREGKWFASEPTGLSGRGPVVICCLGDELILIFTSGGRQLYCARYSVGKGWTSGQSLRISTYGAIALTSYFDYSDESEKIMLCWQSSNGFIRSRIYDDGSWGKTMEVGQLTDGPVALSQLGPSLYLVYKERNTKRMRMSSFNLAPFNAFKAKDFENQPEPENNTSLHQWAPADFPLGHFSGKMAAVKNEYQFMGPLAMAAFKGQLYLVHRAGYADTNYAMSCRFGLTGIFTAANPQTNNFGTLEQAGWTREQKLEAIQIDPANALAVCSDDSTLHLVWQAAGSESILYCSGSYRQTGVVEKTTAKGIHESGV